MTSFCIWCYTRFDCESLPPLHCSRRCRERDAKAQCECTVCQIKFIKIGTNAKYCSPSCRKQRKKPYPPVEIYGNEKNQDFMLAYRRYKYIRLGKFS